MVDPHTLGGTTNRRHPNDQPRLDGALGTVSIVMMVLAAAAPLTVIGAQVPVAVIIGNGPGFPAMYVVAAAVLLLFAVGLSTMARHIPRAGAFFTYVSYGLGRPQGLGAAFVALLTYTAIQASVLCILGSQLAYAVEELHGPALPWWLYSLATVAVTGFFGFRNIELSSKVLGLALIGEIGIVIVLDVVIMVRGGDAGLNADSFTPSLITAGAPAIGIMLAVTAFLGFESTAIYRSEAKDPDRTIPRATYVSILLIGVFYTVSSWAVVIAWGTENVVEAASEDPVGMLMTTARTYLGTWAAPVINILLLSSLFACVLSFHNVIARYLHAMASAGALPARLSRVHPTHASPSAASVTQTLTAGVLVSFIAALGVDPLLEASVVLGGVSTLGFVLLMMLTSVSVLVYFRRTRQDAGRWRTTVAPTLALIGLALMFWFVISNFDLLVGGSVVLAAILACLVLAAMIVGIVQARVVRRRRPEAYASLIESLPS